MPKAEWRESGGSSKEIDYMSRMRDRSEGAKPSDVLRSYKTVRRTLGQGDPARKRLLRGVRRALARSTGLERRAKNVRLVMTLLARDEEDVIGHNIEFHLSHGVDQIVVTDNGSIDGTRDVLRQYERSGCVRVISEPDYTHTQSVWVNRMAEMAVDEYGADIVFHCDADEFWFPLTGNLKFELMQRQSLDGLRVPLRNVLLADRGGIERFPEDAFRIVLQPMATGDLEADSKQTSLYLFDYPSKVIFWARGKKVCVGDGNHRVTEPKNLVMRRSVDIRILHFPIRSFEHFRRKVVNGARAMEAKQDAGLQVNWHWRRWYEAEKKGALKEEYRNLMGHENLLETVEKTVSLTMLPEIVDVMSETRGRDL